MTMHTLVFTDVVDGTRLVERLGDERAAQLWVDHDCRARALLRAPWASRDRSDGFLLLFDEAVDAACYALAYHRAPVELALMARVGCTSALSRCARTRPKTSSAAPSASRSRATSTAGFKVLLTLPTHQSDGSA